MAVEAVARTMKMGSLWVGSQTAHLASVALVLGVLLQQAQLAPVEDHLRGRHCEDSFEVEVLRPHLSSSTVGSWCNRLGLFEAGMQALHNSLGLSMLLSTPMCQVWVEALDGVVAASANRALGHTAPCCAAPGAAQLLS